MEEDDEQSVIGIDEITHPKPAPCWSAEVTCKNTAALQIPILRKGKVGRKHIKQFNSEHDTTNQIMSNLPLAINGIRKSSSSCEGYIASEIPNITMSGKLDKTKTICNLEEFNSEYEQLELKHIGRDNSS